MCKKRIQNILALGDVSIMANRAKRLCRYPGCSELVNSGYCEKHKKNKQQEKKQEQKYYDERRGTAHQRGYTSKWYRYSKWFLRQPENQLCVLCLDDGCSGVAECVDHIVPPSGPDDSLFWDPDNHQPACIHCNSVKGKKIIKGDLSKRG